MRLLVVFLLALFTFVPMSIAYPQDQLEECMLSAKKNPAIQDVDGSSIESFCDCSLNLIMDQGERAKTAANQCAEKVFR